MTDKYLILNDWEFLKGCDKYIRLKLIKINKILASQIIILKKKNKEYNKPITTWINITISFCFWNCIHAYHMMHIYDLLYDIAFVHPNYEFSIHVLLFCCCCNQNCVFHYSIFVFTDLHPDCCCSISWHAPRVRVSSAGCPVWLGELSMSGYCRQRHLKVLFPA